jgi:hypothetical protein
MRTMASKEQRFSKGDMVHHNHYGEGEIIEVDFNVHGLYRIRFFRSGRSLDRWVTDDEI